MSVPKVVGGFLLSLLPFWHQAPAFDFERSIRPLSWSSVHFDMFGDPIGDGEPTVANHCTAWAYHTKDNPTKTHWITASHCVSSLETGEYHSHDYQIDEQWVYVEDWDNLHDIASLSAYGVDAPSLTLARHEPHVYEPGKLMDSLVIIRGFPYGFPDMFTAVGNYIRPHFHDPQDADGIYYNIYTAPIAGGNSGSPVFDRDNKVVGLLQVGWGEDGFSVASGGLDLVDLSTFINQLP